MNSEEPAKKAPHGETWFPPCSTSQDWRVAVEEGATLVRLGSSLFRD